MFNDMLSLNASGGGTVAEETITVTNDGYSRTVTPTKNFVAVTSIENLSDSTRQPYMSKVENGVITYYLINISGQSIPSSSYTQQLKIVGIVE